MPSATTVEDAQAAERGGADRLEVVAAMEADGLLPSVTLVARLRDAVALPVRVMLRCRPGFATDAAELTGLFHAAEQFHAAGVDAFVFGFLAADGQLDRTAMLALLAAATPRCWTLHRAFDQVVDVEQAWQTCSSLPGLDLILSAGSRAGVGEGLANLRRRAAWQTSRIRWLAGGGLRMEHIPMLRAAGITQFHTGRAVRRGGSWEGLVEERLVRSMKEAVMG